MKINDALISRLEKLAQLELPEDERLKLRRDLEKMTDLVGKLTELDRADPPPEDGLSEYGADLLRKDDARPPAQADDILKEAPRRKDDFFQVPRVITPKK
jgi:aspartyl-tRNA(Asn)/glutamyl-tRNA(Gln) amidotransferase subunit C